MSTDTRSTLITAFSTGQIATQADFTNLINGMLNLSSDDVSVSADQNIGIGASHAGGRLTIAGKNAAACTGTISLTSGSATASGSGTAFDTELKANDYIQVSGDSQLYQVSSSPASATSLTLSPTPSSASSGSFQKVFPYLSLVTPSGDVTLTVGPNGKVGIGKIANHELEVAGTISATTISGNLTGDGTGIHGLTASQISGLPDLSAPFQIKAKETAYTSNLTVTANSDQITGTGLDQDFAQGDVLVIGADTYVVTAAPTATSITVSPTPTAAASPTQFTVVKPILQAESSSGNTLTSIAGNGWIGVGTDAPTAPLEVNGDARAKNFVGDGSKLTGLTASQITGLPTINTHQLDLQAGSKSYTGSLVLTAQSTTITGTGLSTDFAVSDQLVIGADTYVVTAVTDTALTVNPAPTAAATVTTSTIVSPLVKLDDSQSNEVFTVLGNGHQGIGTATPSEALEVDGTVKASAFIGDGSGLSGLPSPDTIKGTLTIDEQTSTVSTTLSYEASATSLTGTGLDTLFTVGQQIQYQSANYLITAVTATALTIDPKLSETAAGSISNPTVIKPALLVNDTTGAMQSTMLSNGWLGIGKTPTTALDVDGTVTATAFAGKGDGIINILPANITGPIPLTKLAEINFTDIKGTVSAKQLPSGGGGGSTGTFTIDHPIINAGQQATLTWNIPEADQVSITFLNDNQIVTVDSTSGTINAPSGTYQTTLSQSGTITLTASKSSAVIQQSQIYVTVQIDVQGSVTHEMTTGKTAGYSIATVIVASATKYGLSAMIQPNVTILATGLVAATFTPSEIYQAIPQFYDSTGQDWNPAHNQQWLNAVVYPS